MNPLIEKTYTHKGYRVALHLLFWIAMLAGYYYFNTIAFTPASDTAAAWWLALKNAVEFAAAFYSLMYFIWPQALRKRKWWKAATLLLVWLVAVTALDAWLDQQILFGVKSYALRMQQFYVDYYNFLQGNFGGIVFIRVVSGGLLYHLLMQLSFPIALKIGRSYFRQTVQQLQLAKDNLQLEFNFLKSQVNPHFLFNTLNNIYALVESEKKEQAAATIARLSGFMRYALYETGEEKISLDKEVQLLKDYTELEKLRLNQTEVVFQFQSDSEAYKIPPLLLMPALENAFKYSVDKADSNISVDLRAMKGELQVRIQNNYDVQRLQTGGGIGLANLQKRLQHAYGAKARYAAGTANDVYLFELTLALA